MTTDEPAAGAPVPSGPGSDADTATGSGGAGTGGTSPAAGTPGPARGAAPTRPRRVHIDWDGSASSAVDPEDSVGWRGDADRDLARLLDELPPHHLDR